MADNRDPRKKSRTRRQLRTSSSNRAARSRASAKDTPRPTSSADRASQQGKGSSKVTTGKGRVSSKGNKGGSSALKTTLAAGMVTALATGSLRNPVTAAKQRESKENRKKITKKSTDKYNTKDADGTVRSRAKVGPKKVGPKKVGTVAQAFDKAYASAKKDKKKEFTFKGKKYSTK